jgi:hypothetical protein
MSPTSPRTIIVVLKRSFRSAADTLKFIGELSDQVMDMRIGALRPAYWLDQVLGRRGSAG